MAEDKRYSAVAMTLHWTIAALIVIQLCLGWYMNEIVPDHSPAQDRVQDIHVTVGLSILVLVLVRIIWRLTHRAPPLPAGMPAWERWLAHIVHFLFYLLMLAMPLTGWALVSVRHEGIPFFGLAWPAMPVLDHLGKTDARAIGGQLKHIHIFILVWVVLINLALHVAGAIKHQFDGRPVLWRMLPLFRRPRTVV
jgi:cytochrome b561